MSAIFAQWGTIYLEVKEVFSGFKRNNHICMMSTLFLPSSNSPAWQLWRENTLILCSLIPFRTGRLIQKSRTRGWTSVKQNLCFTEMACDQLRLREEKSRIQWGRIILGMPTCPEQIPCLRFGISQLLLYFLTRASGWRNTPPPSLETGLGSGLEKAMAGKGRAPGFCACLTPYQGHRGEGLTPACTNF